MKRNRIIKPIILTFLFLSLSLFSGCDRNFKGRLNILSYLERKDKGSEELSREKIEELKKSIRAVGKELDRTLSLGKDLGNYYRLVSMEYMNLEMYDLALENFREAIKIFPGNPSLFYHAGICAGQMSRRQTGEQDRLELLLLAETYYRQALDMNPGYWEAAYALAVLYQFELARPADAEPLLKDLLARRPDYIEALFLMAGVQVSLGNQGLAVDYYETIAELTDDEEVRAKALRNRNLIMEGY